MQLNFSQAVHENQIAICICFSIECKKRLACQYCYTDHTNHKHKIENLEKSKKKIIKYLEMASKLVEEFENIFADIVKNAQELKKMEYVRSLESKQYLLNQLSNFDKICPCGSKLLIQYIVLSKRNQQEKMMCFNCLKFNPELLAQSLDNNAFKAYSDDIIGLILIRQLKSEDQLKLIQEKAEHCMNILKSKILVEFTDFDNSKKLSNKISKFLNVVKLKRDIYLECCQRPRIKNQLKNQSTSNEFFDRQVFLHIIKKKRG